MTRKELATIDALLAETIDRVAPPITAKSHLLDLVRQLSNPHGEQSGGVSTRMLSRDQVRGTVTVVLHFAPGARLPGHGHHGAEESFVVRGSCRMGRVSLRQGDFHRIEAGARHGDVVSDGGCVLLVTMDERDYRAA